MPVRYVEPGGSWRRFWALVVVFVVLGVLDRVLPGAGVPPLLWVIALVAVLGIAAAGVLAAGRTWTVTVAGCGPDAVLTVGREQLPLAEVDLDALRAGSTGVDVGAPVLGGGAALPGDGWACPCGGSTAPPSSCPPGLPHS